MTNERKFEFYKLFEELIRSMTQDSTYDEEEIITNVRKLAVFFKLTKTTSEFYRTVPDEKAGRGDIKVGYDNGQQGELFMVKRVVTKTMVVVTCKAYRLPDEEPMDDEEKEKLTIAMNSVLSFVSRHRLEGVVEKFVFFDDTGYPNVRSFLAIWKC